jgi:hypothetical protein
MEPRVQSLFVMAGLVPAIHVFLDAAPKQDVDARHKAGHDGVYHSARLLSFTASASTYTSLPIALNFSLISAMPCCASFSVAA